MSNPFRIFSVIVFASGFVSTSHVLAATAAPAEISAEVARLMDDGRQVSPAAPTDARNRYDRLQSLPGCDARATYALAVVLIQQRRPADALPLLDQVLKARPQLLAAWRTKIWADIAAKRFDECLQDMCQAAAVVGQPGAAVADFGTGAAGKGGADAAANERKATSYLLGCVFSYLEGPRAGAVPADELRRSKQRALGKLGDGRATFDDGDIAVSNQCAGMRDELNAVLAVDAQTQSLKHKVIKSEQKKLDEAEVQRGYQSEKLKTDVKSELALLDHELQTVQTETQKTQYRIKQLEAQASGLQTLLAFLTGSNKNSGPPPAQTTAASAVQANWAAGQLAQVTVSQVAAVTQLETLQANLVQVNQRRMTLLAEQEETAGRLQAEARQLKRDEKKLQKEQSSVGKNASPEARKGRNLLARAQAFSTYVPFSFDDEKARVLGWFEKPNLAAQQKGK